jgi:hypothetical protein
MSELTPAETELVNALAAALAGRCFDTTTILIAAETDSRLAAALDVLVPVWNPNRRRQHGPRLRSRRARSVLTELAERVFDIDEFGWWRLR